MEVQYLKNNTLLSCDSQSSRVFQDLFVTQLDSLGAEGAFLVTSIHLNIKEVSVNEQAGTQKDWFGAASVPSKQTTFF